MTAGSEASRRVLARTPVAPLPASSPTRPTGITGRMSAPPETSSPGVCSVRLPQMCGFRLPLTSRADARDRTPVAPLAPGPLVSTSSVFPWTPSSQNMEPLGNPGRFNVVAGCARHMRWRAGKVEAAFFLPATFHCLTPFWVQTEARLADLGYRQLPTDLAGEHVGNLRVSGYGFNGARGGIRPERMSTALSFQEAAVSA